MFLVDKNVWLELLLEQEKATEARQFFRRTEAHVLSITDFTLYSIGVILTRLEMDDAFEDFLSDSSGVRRIYLETSDLKELLIVRQRLRLDFDDAYQYTAAEKNDLIIVIFDKTERGRRTPGEVLHE